MRALLPAVLVALTACVGGDGGADPGSELTIVVNAPFSKTPYIGRTLERGAQLAVDEINDHGGVKTPGATYSLKVVRMDNALSPQRALNNVRRAVDLGAVAIVDEGTGVDASWEVADQAGIPIGIVYQGGVGLVDLEGRPNVFRIAPTDRGISFRYAEYLVPKGLKIGFLHDDSGYGQEGATAMHTALDCCPESLAADVTVPGGADPAPQVLEARRSGATALVVWAQAATLAEVVRAARSSGWDVPIYASQTAEDPLVRQQLSDHPEWVNGLTFASGRMTAEVGPEPFLDFWAKYEDRFGKDEVGVTTSEGKAVFAPPSYAMYPYDFVHVLAKTIEAAGGPDRAGVLDFLEQVDIRGANGDERGFNEKNHEGVVDDDVYFAVFHDMTFTPVKDDLLSSTLDVIDQVGMSGRVRGGAILAVAGLVLGPLSAQAGAKGEAVKLPTEADGVAVASGSQLILYGNQGIERLLPGAVSDTEVVSIELAPGGAPTRVHVVQRMEVSGVGDYRFRVPGPARDVAPLPGSAESPGLRRGSMIWQGFSEGRERLGATAELFPEEEVKRLPLRISDLSFTVDGAPVPPGDEATGTFELSFEIENVSAIPIGVATGSPTQRLGPVLRTVEQALAAGRGPVPGKDGVPEAIAVRAAPDIRVEDIEAPFRVDGEFHLPPTAVVGQIDGATVIPADDGPRVRFGAQLGGGHPPTHRVTVTGTMDGGTFPALRMTARPALPSPSLVEGAGDGRRGLAALMDAMWRVARIRQYAAYLGNPDPAGPASTLYRYSVAGLDRPVTANGPPVQEGTFGPLAMAATLLALLLVVVDAAAVWRAS